MTNRCAECGFDWDTPILESLRIIAALPQRAASLLSDSGRALERPAEGIWSPNEYLWHMADIFRFSAEWLHDVRTLDHPTHYAVDSDALAALRGYQRLPLATGLWSLAQACSLFVSEAAI